MRIVALSRPLLAAVVLVSLLPVVAAQAVTSTIWSPPVPVSTANRENCGHAVARSLGTESLVLHSTDASLSLATRAVFYRRSFDRGARWFGALISEGTTERRCPRVATFGPLVVVGWLEGILPQAAFVMRVSTNGGASFGPRRRIAQGVGLDAPTIAVTGGAILVAWTELDGSQRWTRLARSTDLGATWQSERLDTVQTEDGFEPSQVAAAELRAIVAWLRPDGTIMGRISTDTGGTWGPAEVLALGNEVSGTTVTTRWSVAASPDRTAIAWTEAGIPGESAQRVLTRVHAGGDWTDPAEAAALPADPGRYGRIRVVAPALLDDDRVGLAWSACRRIPAVVSSDPCGDLTPEEDVLWSESHDDGVSWTVPVVASRTGEAIAGIVGLIGTPSAVWLTGAERGILISRLAQGEVRGRVVFTVGRSPQFVP